MSAARLNDVAPGQRVYAYKNLTRGCWSLKALDGPNKGKVIAHLDTLTLRDASPKVSAAQVRWMREHKSRLVCAGIVGTFNGEAASLWGARVRFSPFTRDDFYLPDNDGATYTGSRFAVFGHHGQVLVHD